MVWCSVQRSGRTSIRATTRSFSASVKVTPFNSANGIFIDVIFSSGVMVGSPPVYAQLSYAGRRPRSNGATSFRDGPKDQTPDAQLRIGESRDSPMYNCTSEVRALRAPE